MKKVNARFHSEKKQRNDENIQQVVDVLTAANYRAGRSFAAANGGTMAPDPSGFIEFWVGPGRIPVIALYYYGNDDGFEVYMPVSQSNRMDETLYALRDITNIVQSAPAPHERQTPEV